MKAKEPRSTQLTRQAYEYEEFRPRWAEVQIASLVDEEIPRSHESNLAPPWVGSTQAKYQEQSGLFLRVGLTILGRPRSSRDARPYPIQLGQHVVLSNLRCRLCRDAVPTLPETGGSGWGNNEAARAARGATPASMRRRKTQRVFLISVAAASACLRSSGVSMARFSMMCFFCSSLPI